MKRAFYLAFFLAVVAAIAGGALTFANDMTKDQIAANKAATEKANLEIIYPGSDFEKLDFTDDTGMIVSVYKANEGYVYQMSTDGFGGKGSIEFMIGFGTDGKISGYTVLSSGETQGIGSKVAEADFVSSVTGKDIGASIDIISGASVSSRAVIKGIDAATAHYEANYK
ncbi:MAG: FMN-binding protein [Erysipelotrichaceae bacterium]|nr:FMN-binding protein [Erysipelotrichaceae bacterium]